MEACRLTAKASSLQMQKSRLAQDCSCGTAARGGTSPNARSRTSKAPSNLDVSDALAYFGTSRPTSRRRARPHPLACPPHVSRADPTSPRPRAKRTASPLMRCAGLPPKTVGGNLHHGPSPQHPVHPPTQASLEQFQHILEPIIKPSGGSHRGILQKLDLQVCSRGASTGAQSPAQHTRPPKHVIRMPRLSLRPEFAGI
eukprot:scaffold133722_cov26-Tisochrysis_lutea.AAC.3